MKSHCVTKEVITKEKDWDHLYRAYNSKHAFKLSQSSFLTLNTHFVKSLHNLSNTISDSFQGVWKR